MKKFLYSNAFAAACLSALIYAPYFVRNINKKLELLDILVPILFFGFMYTVIKELNTPYKNEDNE
jgi:hypothetical protein